MNPKMEIRIWEKSKLIGKSIKDISKEYDVEIIKVARGENATNPDENLIINEADYITYQGDSSSCLKLLKESS